MAFLNKIGCSGEGPEEYIRSLSFSVDEDKKELWVVDSRGNNFVLMSVFLATMMADLADAHYQACFRNNNFESCAWAKVAPYQPKGCNNNALGDTNDSSVVYKSSGHSNCGLTGGVTDTILAKTTHNGQSCGVADVNGLMWEVASGYITDINGIHLVLKESVDISISIGFNSSKV